MSIDRNSYLSLIESVNEAVVGKPVRVPTTKVAPKAAKTAKTTATKVTSTAASKPVNKSAGGGGQGGGGSGIQWGDPSIGGARNAMELAQWLNKQAVPGLVNDAQAASVKTAAASGGAGLKEAKVAGAKKASTSAATTAKTAGANGSGLQWGHKSIGGAMNAKELAQWLNSQSAASAKNNPVSSSSGSAIAEEEDFDMIDEILAEGIELYGEEGLAEILADFEETGEISEELADLLGLE